MIYPGYRFYPTEEELVGFYLWNKLEGTRIEEMERFIPVADVYRFEPPQLPQMAGEVNVRDEEQWFFFCPMQAREAQGGRPTRVTATGYWKATGSPSLVYSSTNRHRAIGLKKTMVFYEGRAPNGRKTKWKMNEYKALEHEGTATTNSAITNSSQTPRLQNDFSLCRVYIKSGNSRSFDRRPSAWPSNIATNEQNNHALHQPREMSSSSQGSAMQLLLQGIATSMDWSIAATTTMDIDNSSSSGEHGLNGTEDLDPNTLEEIWRMLYD